MKNKLPDEAAIFDNVNTIVKNHWSGRSEGEFVSYNDSKSLSELLDLQIEQGTQNWDDIYQWVETYLKYSVKTMHPGFRNRMWSGANLPSIIGEMIAAVSNTSACTYESAPVSTLMEKYLIQEMLRIVGFENGEGQMTTGSSNANMVAMLAARNSINPESKNQGLYNASKLKAFVSIDAHYSLDKTANVLGIGVENLIKIPVDIDGKMNIKILEDKINESVRNGDTPFFVCATAGTTIRGSYDSITKLLTSREKFNFWLHVDGAWGGAVVFSRELRQQLLAGIEQVDSFTWDFHKMPGTALICNILLFNDKSGVMSRACGIGDTSYIFHDEDNQNSDNLGVFSLQCGRHVDSLKWFLDWKFYGQSGFAERIEKYWDLSKYAEKLVNSFPELEMTVPRASFNVCFRFRTPVSYDMDDFNLSLRKRLYQKGESLIGTGNINHQKSLRLLITNPELNASDIENLLKNIVKIGNQLLISGT